MRLNLNFDILDDNLDVFIYHILSETYLSISQLPTTKVVGFPAHDRKIRLDIASSNAHRILSNEQKWEIVSKIPVDQFNFRHEAAFEVPGLTDQQKFELLASIPNNTKIGNLYRRSAIDYLPGLTESQKQELSKEMEKF